MALQPYRDDEKTRFRGPLIFTKKYGETEGRTQLRGLLRFNVIFVQWRGQDIEADLEFKRNRTEETNRERKT